MDSCFALVEAHHHGIAVGQERTHSLLRRVNERGKPVYQRPFTAEGSAKHSFKRQLHRTPRCWLSSLLREIFLRVFRFPPSSKTNILKFQFNQESGRRRIVIFLLLITKGYGVRATTIEGQNAFDAFAPTMCFAYDFRLQMVKQRVIKLRVKEGRNARDQTAFSAFHSLLMAVQTNAGYIHETTWRLGLRAPLVARNYLFI